MAPTPLSATLSALLPSDDRILKSRQLADKAAREFRITYDNNPLLDKRQSNGGYTAIPTVYAGLNAGPAPGAVVGIVLGSVLGFLFLIWLFFVLSKGGFGFIRTSEEEEESVVVTRSERRHQRSDRSRRSRGPEMAARTSPRRDRVYRSERVVREYPPARAESRSRVRETVIVDDLPPRERRVEGDDVVEVIEEHSDIVPPRRKSRRGSGYRRGQTDF